MGMQSGDPRINPSDGLEAWKWTGRGKLMIARFTGKYGETEFHPVAGGRVFHLTPAERRMNSDKAFTAAVDVFSNGQCLLMNPAGDTPDEDLEKIRNNPAMIGDEQVDQILKAAPAKMAAALEDITNVGTLARILDRAIELDVANSKVTHIQARIIEIDPAALGKGTEPIPIPAIVEPDGRSGSIDSLMNAAVGADAITVGFN